MATIKKIAEELNWEGNKKEAYGKFNGFTVSLIQNISYMNQADNFKKLIIPFEKLTTESFNTLKNFIETNKKELKVLVYDLGSETLVIRLKEVFKGINGEGIKEILSILIKGLLEARVEPKTTCIYCGEDETDDLTYINQVKLPAHRKCKEDAIVNNVHSQSVQAKNSSSAYFGAVMGAIIGVIPYAVAVWFGWYVGLLSILTGFVSYYGFKTMGGKVNKSTKFIISIISMAIVLLSNVAIVQIVASMNNVSFADVLSIPELHAAFIEMLSMSAIFGFIGVVAVFSKIARDESPITIK